MLPSYKFPLEAGGGEIFKFYTPTQGYNARKVNFFLLTPLLPTYPSTYPTSYLLAYLPIYLSAYFSIQLIVHLFTLL